MRFWSYFLVEKVFIFDSSVYLKGWIVLKRLLTSLFFGGGLWYFGKNASKNIDFIEQLILIISVYFLTSLLVAIPFYLSNYQVTLLNSIFESVSGLTGTGF